MTQSTPSSTNADPSAPSSEASPTGPTPVQIGDADATVCYANFCRVTGTPEELILDFGLNTQPYGAPGEPIRADQRLVINYFTAKRMVQALAASVARHEQAFGALETDVQKRVIAPPAAAGSSP